MKKILFYGLGICCLWIPLAAQVPQQVVASGGTVDTQSFTVGEAVVTSLGSSPGLTQGFHQPRLTVTAISAVLPIPELQVWPNPTLDHVSVQIPVDFPEPYQIRLVSMDGKVLKDDRFTLPGQQHSYDLSAVSAGMYFLEVRGGDHKQTFKIEKLSY